MTTQTVSGAVARKDKADHLVNWLRGQQDEIAMAAASHIKPSTVVRIANGALRKDDKLMAAAIANPLSLLHCLLDAARLGHEPGTDQYYLVPFGSEVTGIEGYKGIIERMFRAGAVSAVVAEVVYQRDIYHRQGATQPPVHEFDEFADPADRGPLRGAYAYAVMLDGRFSKIIPMGRAEIMKHKAVSRGSDRADSPWQKWEESMWKKCPLRGLEPYVPTSSEWLTARLQAAATVGRPVQVTGFTPPVPAPAGNGHAPAEAVVDAEIVEDPPAGDAGVTAEPAGNRRRPLGKTTLGRLQAALKRLPLGEQHDVLAAVSFLAGRPVSLLEDLSNDEAVTVTKGLDGYLERAGGDSEEAVSALWAAYRQQLGAEASQEPPEGTDG